MKSFAVNLGYGIMDYHTFSASNHVIIVLIQMHRLGLTPVQMEQLFRAPNFLTGPLSLPPYSGILFKKITCEQLRNKNKCNREHKVFTPQTHIFFCITKYLFYKLENYVIKIMILGL